MLYLSTRHVHAVAATVRVVRKKLISCKINFSGMGCCEGGLTLRRASGRQYAEPSHEIFSTGGAAVSS